MTHMQASSDPRLVFTQLTRVHPYNLVMYIYSETALRELAFYGNCNLLQDTTMQSIHYRCPRILLTHLRVMHLLHAGRTFQNDRAKTSYSCYGVFHTLSI